MEKKVNICDACETQIAKNKCKICNKDICLDCSSFFNITISRNVLQEIPFFSVEACKKCYEQLNFICINKENLFEQVVNDNDELKNKIIELIKNTMMLNKISDEEIEKINAKPFDPFGIIKPRLLPPQPSIYPYKSPYKTPPFKKPKKWYISKTKQI